MAEDYFKTLFAADPNWQELNLSFIKSRVPMDENIKLSVPFSTDEFKHDCTHFYLVFWIKMILALSLLLAT